MAGAGVLAGLLGSDRHWAFHYGYPGSTPTGALLHPLRTVTAWCPGSVRADNLALVGVGLLLPLGLLPAYAPAASPWAAIPALPLLASSHSQFHSIRSHDDAFLFPFVLLAAAGGLARTHRTWAGSTGTGSATRSWQ